MKVLYITAVGPFGGASRSLYEAISALEDGAVSAYFVSPPGTALNYYGHVAEGVITTRGISRFDHSRVSHYRGLRWLVILRELFHLPFTVAALLRARRRWPDIDLIHVNEIFDIGAGLLAKRLFRVPLVVHVRALVERNPGLARTRWLHQILRRSADAIIAIDENVRATLPSDLEVDVIHNAFTAPPSGRPDEEYLARLATLRPDALQVGFVGNLLRIKGLAELIEAARLVKASGENVQFVMIGGKMAPETGLFRWLLKKAGLAQSMSGELEAKIAAYGLTDDIVILGPTGDIQRVLPKLDVLAFPTHFDAPGRPVFEAAFYGVPSIVAVSAPREDTVIDGETAIAIERPDPALIADAILYFARNRAEVGRMGANARALAQRNFDPATNSAKLSALYRRVLSRTRSQERDARSEQPAAKAAL